MADTTPTRTLTLDGARKVLDAALAKAGDMGIAFCIVVTDPSGEPIVAARMDHASEWQIYWRIILPLAAPALAVLAIFSIMWRWNDFLWPLIVLSKNEHFTLQRALNAFRGDLVTQWHYLLAMTVITLLPITLVFAFLQKYITQGIASAGVK